MKKARFEDQSKSGMQKWLAVGVLPPQVTDHALTTSRPHALSRKVGIVHPVWSSTFTKGRFHAKDLLKTDFWIHFKNRGFGKTRRKYFHVDIVCWSWVAMVFFRRSLEFHESFPIEILLYLFLVPACMVIFKTSFE